MSDENLEKTSIEDVKKQVDKILKESETNTDEVKLNEKTNEREERNWKEKVLEENPDLSDFEKEQVATGWNPKGDKTAEEWESNVTFREEVKRRGKEIKNLKKTIAQQNERLAAIEQEAYERAKRELIAAKEYAVQSNDVSKATEIDRRINELPDPVRNQTPQPILDFMENHAEWLEGDKGIHLKMRIFTAQMDNELIRKGYSPEVHMQKLDELVREEFHNYFKPTEEEYKIKSPAVSDDYTSGVISKSKPKFDARSLTDEEKDVLRFIEKSGQMSKEDYLKKLNECKQ